MSERQEIIRREETFETSMPSESSRRSVTPGAESTTSTTSLHQLLERRPSLWLPERLAQEIQQEIREETQVKTQEEIEKGMVLGCAEL